MTTRFLASVIAASSLAVVALAACSSDEDPSSPATPDAAPNETDGEDAATPVVDEEGLEGCTQDPGAPEITFDANSATDPMGGAENFTLDKALEGFPAGNGTLTAAIRTEQGTIKCELDEANAPLSVANFVGLARGTRPYKKVKTWVVGHFYDNLLWHRVIPGFVIQGGDPQGKGTGGPGYDMVVENHVDEPAGTLAMAAAQKPSGSQFYIVVGTGPAADYNVFGKCDLDAAKKIAAVDRGANDRPTSDVHMLSVRIGRCP